MLGDRRSVIFGNRGLGVRGPRLTGDRDSLDERDCGLGEAALNFGSSLKCPLSSLSGVPWLSSPGGDPGPTLS